MQNFKTVIRLNVYWLIRLTNKLINQLTKQTD